MLRPCKKKEGSGRRRIVFELLEIAVFDLLHEGFALEEVALEVGGELTGDNEKLVVGNSGERDGAAGGNEMGTPLENEAGVPESGDGDDDARSGEGGAAGAEELNGTIVENGKTENEKRSERNEKAVAIGRDAVPIGVTGDEKIKSDEAGKQQSAHERFAAPEEEKSDDGEEKNGRPSDQSMIGRKKDGKKIGGKPVPVLERNVTGFERTSINEVARDESGEQTNQENGGKEQVAEEKLRDAWSGIGRGGRVRAKRQVILAEGFEREDGENHTIGVINVEHESGDDSENQPLREGAR